MPPGADGNRIPAAAIERIVLVVSAAATPDEQPDLELKAASWCDRLCAGGLQAVVVRADGDIAAGPFAAAARSTLVVPLLGNPSDAESALASMSALPPPLSACTPWSLLAPGPPHDCGALIRAIVQHNYTIHARAAAAIDAAAAT